MDRRVETALQLMKGNLQQNSRLSEIAASVNLSASRLSHLFKTETGVSPAKHLKRARMERAKQLLETSFLSVKQVMVAVGINDSSHFVRSFKNAYGLTPTDYRSSMASSRRPSLHVTSHPVITGNHMEHNNDLPRVANLK
jgi:AraC family transcriptional regulator, arabinose operon regulatory protein